MVQFDNQNRLIKIKIVYYGPALGGKTTSLRFIHQQLDPERRTRLFSLNTAQDRTLFFDLMSLKLGRFREHDLSLKLFTVPGQVHYNATRRAVLVGADGVVFVADSQKSKLGENVESLKNLRENLDANGIAADIPLVFQYNKQDLSDLAPIDTLHGRLNSRNVPEFATTATSGRGVMEAFAEIVEQAVLSAVLHLGASESESTRQAIRQRVRESFAGVPEPRIAEAVDHTVIVQEAPGSVEVLDQGELIEQAVNANLQLSEMHEDMELLKESYQKRSEVLEAAAGFAREVSSFSDAKEVLRSLLDSSMKHLSADAGGVFLFEEGKPKEFALQHLVRDPLLAEAPLLVKKVLERKEAALLCAEPGSAVSSEEAEILVAHQFSSALIIPLIIQNMSRAFLMLYRREHRLPFGDEEIQLGVMMAQQAGASYSNISNWRELQEKNRNLEERVAERTAELRRSLIEVRELHASLEERHLELEQAHSKLEEVDRLRQDILNRVSHELRTPVSSILTATTILKEEAGAIGNELFRMVSIVDDETRKLAELVDGVLRTTEILALEELPPIQEVDTAEFLKVSLQALRSMAEAREVGLRLRVSTSAKAFHCEAQSLSLALQAVCRNAIDFSPAGGAVEILVTRRGDKGGDWLVIRVDDLGPGIRAEDRERVFEAFWQGGDILTAKPPGVGLGLTVARRIVDLHGGRIRIGTSPAGGTRVELLLPEPSSPQK